MSAHLEPVASLASKPNSFLLDEQITTKGYLLRGGVAAIIYSVIAKVNPLFPTILLSLNGLSLINIKPFSEIFSSSTIIAPVIKIISLVALHQLFKRLYTCANMFDSKWGGRFYFGVTAVFVGMNCIELYLATKKHLENRKSIHPSLNQWVPPKTKVSF